MNASSDPPTITLGKTVNSVYFEGDNGTFVDDSLTITDKDDIELDRAEITISTN